MQTGLYLYRLMVGVRRVVSEDSDDIGTWLTSIHGFGYSDDPQQPIHDEMLIRPHEPQTFGKLQEIDIL